MTKSIYYNKINNNYFFLNSKDTVL